MSSMVIGSLGQVYDDIARHVETRSSARRHDAGTVVLLDNQRTRAHPGQVRTSHHCGLHPAMGRPEIRLPRRRRYRLRATGAKAIRYSGASAAALSDDLDGDQFHRLVLTGAMPISLL